MRPSSVGPVPEEPWAQRLRITKSRSVRAPVQSHSNHLPSPWPTNLSSTDNVRWSSSSTADNKTNQRQNVVHSLRDRFAPVSKKPTYLPSTGKAGVTTKDSTKPSVAPFFRRLEAAFRDKPTSATAASRVVGSKKNPVRSPSPDAEDLIQQLKEHYLQTATTLHQSATMRLAQAHADLSRRLTQTLVKSDAAFLESTEAHVRKLTQPLDAVRIRSQQRGRDGALRSEESTVGELVARAEEQLREFEKCMAELWAEWAVADEEVKTLLKGIGSLSSFSSSSSSPCSSPMGVQGGNEGAGTVGSAGEEGEEMLRRVREAIERQIEEAEEEAVDLGEKALALMKGIEKDFRKETLPDLHTFFQSIDEP